MCIEGRTALQNADTILFSDEVLRKLIEYFILSLVQNFDYQDSDDNKVFTLHHLWHLVSLTIWNYAMLELLTHKSNLY